MVKVRLQVEEMLPESEGWRELRKKHPSLLKALDDMSSNYRCLFELIEEQESANQKEIIFLLLGSTYREFAEIMVLALNGYGSGATKILRALYESTVTMPYLMRNPKKI